MDHMTRGGNPRGTPGSQNGGTSACIAGVTPRGEGGSRWGVRERGVETWEKIHVGGVLDAVVPTWVLVVFDPYPAGSILFIRTTFN